MFYFVPGTGSAVVEKKVVPVDASVGFHVDEQGIEQPSGFGFRERKLLLIDRAAAQYITVYEVPICGCPDTVIGFSFGEAVEEMRGVEVEYPVMENDIVVPVAYPYAVCPKSSYACPPGAAVINEIRRLSVFSATAGTQKMRVNRQKYNFLITAAYIWTLPFSADKGTIFSESRGRICLFFYFLSCSLKNIGALFVVFCGNSYF